MPSEFDPFTELMKKLVSLTIVMLAGLLTAVVTISPESPCSVLHPDMTYTAVEGKDGTLTCVSDRFDRWPFKSVRSTAIMNWERISQVRPGDRFTVTQRIDNTTPLARAYVVKQ